MITIPRRRLAVTCVGFAWLGVVAPGVGDPGAGPMSVAEVAEATRRSVVVIDVAGRDGEKKGLGTGFVVRPDGVIATNAHVIGEARPIQVRFAGDARAYTATTVVAVDRALDLALIRIDRDDLPALPLADSDHLHTGQPLMAIGNPLGFRHSVVDGVLSARRTFEDGRDMLQLGMPIEPGNSGGPVLDRQGRVVGIVTLKSSTVARIGFALPINALKPLLDEPNPVAMSDWLTIGALDGGEWVPRLGGTWRQRAGRIIASDLGDGFGGRTLCLSTMRFPPEQPFELAVEVKLADESGAAGLAFHADGADKHYGFYPSGGKLRLTRFAGPDVFSWQILAEVDSSVYRPGRWNTIKVRIDGPTITCLVNDTQVAQTEDAAFRTGRIGLVKFREPTAEFKHFRFGRTLPPTTVAAALVEKIDAEVAKLGVPTPPGSDLVDMLLPHADDAINVLRDRARKLADRAAQLRELADRIHQRSVEARMHRLFATGEAEVDLIHAALLIARLDNDDLEIDAYRWMVNRIANDIRESLPPDADDAAKLDALKRHMFNRLGFHGSRADYYDRSNSYLNEVLDDREGLPITLSVVFIELARRLDLPVVGVGLPGHFVVRYEPAGKPGRLIDVFGGGKAMTREQAAELVRTFTEQALKEEHLVPVSNRAIIIRMLRNLIGVARREQDLRAMLRYLDLLLVVAPESGPDRWDRARLRWQNGQSAAALEDVDWILEHRPHGVDLQRVAQLRNLLRRGE